MKSQSNFCSASLTIHLPCGNFFPSQECALSRKKEALTTLHRDGSTTDSITHQESLVFPNSGSSFPLPQSCWPLIDGASAKR